MSREVDEPIHIHFRVTAEEAHRLIDDPAFVARARLLLHEQAGGCYSADPSRCYDMRHHPPIAAAAFLQRLFGLGPRPADGKRHSYDFKGDRPASTLRDSA